MKQQLHEIAEIIMDFRKSLISHFYYSMEKVLWFLMFTNFILCVVRVPVVSGNHWSGVCCSASVIIHKTGEFIKYPKKPKYLLDLLTDYVPPRTLRSSYDDLLTVPSNIKTVTASRAFWASAPKLWNKLPFSVKSNCSYEVFKRRLKTHLYSQVFT